MLEKISLGVLTFIMIFWIVIFVVLPLKIKSIQTQFFFTCILSFLITILIMIYGPQGLEYLEKLEWNF